MAGDMLSDIEMNMREQNNSPKAKIMMQFDEMKSMMASKMAKMSEPEMRKMMVHMEQMMSMMANMGKGGMM